MPTKLAKRNIKTDLEALRPYLASRSVKRGYGAGSYLTKSTADGFYVALDGSNQASWIPNPLDDETQDITGHFNLATNDYAYKIEGTPVVQTTTWNDICLLYTSPSPRD